ncbi:MAG: hypothetical protein ACRD2G_09300 [Terriglobia bacterium]
MNWLVIVLRPLCALAFFGLAAFLSSLVMRFARRRGWNGRLWKYLTKPQLVSDPKAGWAPVLWLLGTFIAIIAFIYCVPNSPV